ncbi:MAG: hypothetical protein M5U01_38345 [Ardenticatenaceae bacterium]|nr:hypothetical protein [Ardenticatenaceae bacterium]
MSAQVDQLAVRIPRALDQLAQGLNQYAWSRALLAQTPALVSMLPGERNLLARVTGIFSTTFGF